MWWMLGEMLASVQHEGNSFWRNFIGFPKLCCDFPAEYCETFVRIKLCFFSWKSILQHWTATSSQNWHWVYHKMSNLYTSLCSSLLVILLVFAEAVCPTTHQEMGARELWDAQGLLVGGLWPEHRAPLLPSGELGPQNRTSTEAGKKNVISLKIFMWDS